MEPTANGTGLGVGGIVCINRSFCLVGVGHYEGTCASGAGLVGLAIAAWYPLVVDVFRFASDRLVATSHGYLVTTCIGGYKSLQSHQARSIQPDAAAWRLAVVFPAVEFYAVAPQWWWHRLGFWLTCANKSKLV